MVHVDTASLSIAAVILEGLAHLEAARDLTLVIVAPPSKVESAIPLLNARPCESAHERTIKRRGNGTGKMR